MGISNLKYSLLIAILTFLGCRNDEKKLEQYGHAQKEIIEINGKKYLNQTIYLGSEKQIIKKKSRYYTFKNNCLYYFTNIDTNSFKLGVNRFIVYKTSSAILPDFSNVDQIKLEDHYFKSNTKICFESKLMPKNGFIEDIVFLKTAKKIKGEDAVRIVTKYMYIDFGKTQSFASSNL